MKHPRLTQDLVTVAELRANLAEHLRRLEEHGRPLIITQRGRATAALVHPKMLDEIEEHQDLVRRVLRSLKAVATGQATDASDLWTEVGSFLADADARDRDRARAQGVEGSGVGPIEGP